MNGTYQLLSSAYNANLLGEAGTL